MYYSGYSQVIISEFQSSNTSTISDEWGDYDDWIELYNPNNYSVNIEGLVLKNNAHIWGIPVGNTSTLLSPGSYFLIWADHEETEGIFHANFRLSTSETLIICESDSNTIIDSLIIPSLDDDVSYGICPDGEWKIYDTPSPMEANNCDTKIDQTIETDVFFIYPKITRDYLLIKCPTRIKEKVDLKLISISGLILFEKTFYSKEFTLSLDKYNSGVYILFISSENNSWKEKIIKTN